MAIIVSSAFNFIQKPTQILVDLADGTRLPANRRRSRRQPHDRAAESARR